LENFVLPFSFNAVPLNDIEVIVGALKAGLHLGELVLNAVELNTSLFTIFSHFTDLFFLLAQLKIDAFVFVGQLLGQSVLEAHHENLKYVSSNGYLRDLLEGRFLRRHRSTGQRLHLHLGRRRR
jgi:hypothetical protein